MRQRSDPVLMESLFRDGVPDDVAAERLGIKVGSLHKAQIRRGLRAPSVDVRPMTPEKTQRAKILLDEGLPIPWVAEDVGVSVDVIEYAFPDHRADPEWVRVCASVIHTTRQLELHRAISKGWNR